MRNIKFIGDIQQTMKKIILFILSVNLLLAFPPNNAYFDNLLSDNGKIIKNTLKIKKLDSTYSCATIYFDGEITLTGVLERSTENDMEDIYASLRFYPDNNINLPFLYTTHSHNIKYYKEKEKEKEFARLYFGVLLDDKNVSLPEPLALNKRFLGVSAVRAEVTIRNYHFYGEGEADREAYGELVHFKALGDIQTEYLTKDNYYGGVYYYKLEYNSKDDYVNIRDKPNGKIIGKILKNDMINNDALLLYIVNLEGEDLVSIANWVEVLYFPPNAKDERDAFYGFVHASQVKYTDWYQ